MLSMKEHDSIATSPTALCYIMLKRDCVFTVVVIMMSSYYGVFAAGNEISVELPCVYC